MECGTDTYEFTLSYINPYNWECRPWTVGVSEGEESWTDSIAECPEGSRISGCMCDSSPERGCKGSYMFEN